jgi:hypothetical protein
MSRASDSVVSLFEYLLENGPGKPPSKVRPADMRHILLVLPFLLPDLLLQEVQEYNWQNPRGEPLVDSSSDVIEVTLLFSTWYRQGLFRRCYPPNEEDDLKELQGLGDWYLKFAKYM